MIKQIIFILLITTNFIRAQTPVMGTITGASSHTFVPPGPFLLNYSVSATNSPTSYTWAILPLTQTFVSISSGQNTGSITLSCTPCGCKIFSLTCTASNSNGVSSIASTKQIIICETVCNINASTLLGNSSPTICNGTSVTALSSGAFSYNWSSNPASTFSTGLHTPQFSHQSTGLAYISPTITTVYTVIGACYGVCLQSNPATITITVIDCTYLNEKNNNDFLCKIFPNPANNKFTIDLNERQNASITISNVLGQIVFAKETNTTNKLEIDCTNWPNGIYFTVAEINGNKKIIKLVKE